MLCLSRVSTTSLKAGKPHRNSADNISAPSDLTATETEPPEGGLEAWCTVLGCFLAQFCGFGSDEIANLTNSFLHSELSGEREPISHFEWDLYVAPYLTEDICETNYHVWISGAILLSFSIFMLSFVKPGSYYQILLTQGLGCGIAQGLMYVPSFAVLSHHFNRRRTAMASIVASGVPLGGIVHTIMLNKLLNGSVGFQTDASEIWTHAKENVGEFLEGSKGVLYGGTFASDDIWIPSDMALVHLFFLLRSFIGRFCIGLVTPFIGIVDLTIVATVVCAILIIGMIWLGTVVSVVVIGILYGLSTGMNIAMMAPMLALTSDPAELGSANGSRFCDHRHVFAFSTGLGALVGTPISGALLTGRYIWWAPALFCGVIALTAGLLFIALRLVFFRTAPRRE
ncbi:MFS general substrate transporter [Melanogaster broomeanus]|nr:MFS general substrate transporter [Melanogaster broomeanus]